MNDHDDHDELDDPAVRDRLERLRTNQYWKASMAASALDQLRQQGTRPLTEGQTPESANGAIDAFGRGPGSPFYQPGFRPPWAPHWTPREYGAHFLGQNDPVAPADDDDGIEWRVI